MRTIPKVRGAAVLAILLAAGGLACGLAGCQTKGEPESPVATPTAGPAVEPAPGGPSLDVSPDAARELGLRVYWKSKLIMAPGDKVRQARLLGDQLAVLTRKNMFYLVDVNTSKPRPMDRIAPEGSGDFKPPTFDGLHYFFAGGERVVGVNALTGEVDVKITLEMPANTSAISDKELVYTGSLNGQIFVYGIEDRVKHWNSKVGPAVTSLQFYKEVLVAAYSDVAKNHGEVVARRINMWDEIWTQPTDGPIQAPILVNDDAVFVASQDGSVYRFNAENGWPEFRQRTPGILVDEPVMLADRIVQIVPGHGTLLLNKGKNETIWKDPARLEYLGQAENRMYFFDGKRVVCKKADTGETLGSVPVSNASTVMTVPDPDKTKLYLLDAAGNLLCLNDLGQPYLVIQKR